MPMGRFEAPQGDVKSGRKEIDKEALAEYLSQFTDPRMAEVALVILSSPQMLARHEEDLSMILPAACALFPDKFDDLDPLLQVYRTFRRHHGYGGAVATFLMVSQGVLLLGWSFEALTPFLFEEEDGQLVHRVAQDMAVLYPAKDPGSLSGPKLIVKSVERGDLKNCPAALLGLLLLGDNRICELVEPMRDSLTDEDLKALLEIATGAPRAATIEFYVKWLKETAARSEPEERLRLIASLLVKHLQEGKEGAEVVDGTMVFGGDPREAFRPERTLDRGEFLSCVVEELRTIPGLEWAIKELSFQ